MSDPDSPLIAITGASAGIGAAVAIRFAKEGFRVALMSRRLEKLKEIHSKLPGSHRSYALDIRSSKNVSDTFETIQSEMGPIDLLVNNAGCALGLEPAYECSIEDWEICVQTNIQGLLNCTHAVLPSMVARNRGHIINLGSVAGTYPYPGGHVYGATKAFVHQFSLNLRADLIGKNVRVSCIEPGLVGGTEFSLIRFRGNQEKALKPYENTQPLTAEDIAEIIYFCHRLPPHVNVNTIEVMPIGQASAPLAIHRK